MRHRCRADDVTRNMYGFEHPREMHGFESPHALVEIDWAVGLDAAGNCVGPLLVAVEFVIVMGQSFRSARQPGLLDPRLSWRARLL